MMNVNSSRDALPAIYMCLHVNNPKLILDAFNSYYAPSITKDNSALLPVVNAVFPGCFCCRSLYPNDIGTLLPRVKASFCPGSGYLPSDTHVFGCIYISVLLSNLPLGVITSAAPKRPRRRPDSQNKVCDGILPTTE